MSLASINSVSSSIAQFEKQRRFMDSLVDPFGLQKWTEQHRRQQKLFEDPFGLRKQEKMLQQVLRPTVLEQLSRQQGVLDEFVSGPRTLQGLATAYGAMPTGVIDQVEEYGNELIDEITDEAAAAEEPIEVLDAGPISDCCRTGSDRCGLEPNDQDPWRSSDDRYCYSTAHCGHGDCGCCLGRSSRRNSAETRS